MSIKINIGCGPDIKEGYCNIDVDTKEQIIERYGLDKNSFKNKEVYQYDIFNLPFADSSVEEILACSSLEHLSFEEEKKFFTEATRVLAPNGRLVFTVPDFDFIFEKWLHAKDDFVDFYKVGIDEHWFGQNNRNIENKWGYLTAHIFGNQNGQGQFHKNAYTTKKIMKMLNMLGYYYQISFFDFKNTGLQFIQCEAVKK